MKQSHRLLFFIFLIPLLFGYQTQAQSQIEPGLASGPEIKSISPKRAVAGQKVTIRGRKFRPTPEENIVLFGERRAEVVKAKPRKLVVIIPADLPPGDLQVSVSVEGQVSNLKNIEIVDGATPLPGQFRGVTSQNTRISFVVLEDRKIVTSLGTSFGCASAVCSTTVSVDIDRFGTVDNGHFEVEISNSNITAKIQGIFISEVEAEGTAEFTFSGACNCDTIKLTWAVKRELPPPSD